MNAPIQRARALLDAARTRGDIKRLAPQLDGEPELRGAIVTEGRARGADLPDEAIAWPSKRLLRVARGREAQARVRTNPIARDEAFTCAHCRRDVPAHGRTARDHCPACLHSLHVDVVPGDRAAGCGGLLRPIHAEGSGDTWMIHYRCERCGAARRNRAILDGTPADSWEAVVALTVPE